LKSDRSLFLFVFKLGVVFAILEVSGPLLTTPTNQIVTKKIETKSAQYLKSSIPSTQTFSLGAIGNLQ
jgi:hypothetical protein